MRVALICQAFCILTVIGIVAAPQFSRPAKAAPDDQSCAGFPNDFDCYTAHESEKLNTQPNAVRRSNDRLVVTAANGKVLELQNKDQCGQDGKPLNFDECIGYVYVDRVGAGRGHLILKAHTEGYSYVLIDVATGTSAEIGDIPRFSPNASQFVLVGTATGADWTFGKIQIWRMDSDAIEKEFDWEYGDPFDGTKSSTVWQLDFKEWSSEDRVLLNAGAVENSSLGPHQSTIVKSAGSWKILMPSPSS